MKTIFMATHGRLTFKRLTMAAICFTVGQVMTGFLEVQATTRLMGRRRAGIGVLQRCPLGLHDYPNVIGASCSGPDGSGLTKAVEKIVFSDTTVTVFNLTSGPDKSHETHPITSMTGNDSFWVSKAMTFCRDTAALMS